MADEWIWIVRWEEFQHYAPDRDQAPAWIKTYTKQHDDDGYRALTAGQRALLHDLRLGFARSHFKLRSYPAQLTQRFGLRVTSAQLAALNHAGLIEIVSREVLEQRLEMLYASRAPARSRRSREEEEPSPTPPRGRGNGQAQITKKELRRYTGCRMTRGTHGFGWKHDPLGTDKPPANWPHEPPTADEVMRNLAIRNAANTQPTEGATT
jgi:hypothetical protein